MASQQIDDNYIKEAEQFGLAYWASRGISDIGSLLRDSGGNPVNCNADDQPMPGDDNLPLFTEAQQTAYNARIYPATAEQIHKHKMTVEGRYWATLHLLNNDAGGSSWTLDSAVNIIANATGNHPKYIRRVIRRGMDHFWQMQHGLLCTFSQERIAAILGHKGQTLEGRGYRIADTALDNLVDFRAALLAVILAHRKEQPISHAAIRQATNLTPSTVISYKDRHGIDTRVNYGRYASHFTRKEAHQIARASDRRAYSYKDKDGHYQVIRQLPNSYKVHDCQRANKGRTTKRNKRFRDLASSHGGWCDSSNRLRIYHSDLPAAMAARAEHRGIEHWGNQGVKLVTDTSKDTRLSGRGYYQAASGYPCFKAI